MPPLDTRDLDVWRAIVAALEATRAFAVVQLGERPTTHTQFGSGSVPAAIVTPLAWQENDPWDNETDVDIRIDCQYLITLVHRDDDAATRFATLDRLHQVAANAIDGQSLAGLTIPGLTRLKSGSYEAAAEPEKHLIIRGEYSYFVPGYHGRNETDDDEFDRY